MTLLLRSLFSCSFIVLNISASIHRCIKVSSDAAAIDNRRSLDSVFRLGVKKLPLLPLGAYIKNLFDIE